MTTPPLSKMVTFLEAATMLGFTPPRAGRKVYRWIMRQPWADHVLVPLHAPNARQKHYRLSVAALKAHAPQLRPKRDELEAMLREAVEEIEDEVQDVREEVQTALRVIGTKLREIERRRVE